MRLFGIFTPLALAMTLLCGSAFSQTSSSVARSETAGLNAELKSVSPSRIGEVSEKNAGMITASGKVTYFEAVNETTYIVGPGDAFRVSFSANGENAEVDPEGYVSITGVPAIQVGGKPLMAAKKAIVQGASSYYKADRVHVTLINAKAYQVSIAGAVLQPGFYPVSPSTRLSVALDKAGGFSFMATRRVMLTTAKGESRVIDMLDYFTKGDLNQNPYLNQGDRILALAINLDTNIVFIRDAKAVRPMQIIEGEGLDRLLQRYDNFTNIREWQVVQVYRDNHYLETVKRKDASKYIPQPGTTLEMHSIKEVIFVGGAVVQPGEFGYDPRFNAMDYIAMAGVMVGTATKLRHVEVIDASGKLREVDAAKEPLRPGDHILVPRSNEAVVRDYLGIISAISSLAVAMATLVLLTH